MRLSPGTLHDTFCFWINQKVIPLVHYSAIPLLGVSNRWNGIGNGTVEWKMEWNGERT